MMSWVDSHYVFSWMSSYRIRYRTSFFPEPMHLFDTITTDELKENPEESICFNLKVFLAYTFHVVAYKTWIK